MTTPIPHPPRIPLLGNLTDIEFEVPTRSTELLAKKYGEIYGLRILGERMVVICSVKLAQEVLDESRFHKYIESTLEEVRNLVGDGLFTARHGEPNWGIAHRILMPAFGPLAIKGMFKDMVDVVSQLVLKWERFGPQHDIDPTMDFTRLAFDTIALCTFNHRLNSFYTESEPTFVKAMGEFLTESGMRAIKPNILKLLPFGANAKYTENIKIMSNLADQIVADRKQHPIEKKDLLNAMLLGRDPQTGQGLSEENIKAQMLTFLIAGHETTSGMLSFTMAHIMKNPEVYSKVRQEVDAVLGQEPIKLEHLSKLTYINAVLRESLRVTPSIPEFAVTCDKDEIIGDGKYLIKAGTTVAVAAGIIGKDPLVWGEDAEKFNPDRMLDGKFEALPPKSWLPFGNGARGCIGRPFAWQEALIAIATIFQKFDFTPSDPAYNLQLKQTLTLKPKNFTFRATSRQGAPCFTGIAPSASSDVTGHSSLKGVAQNVSGSGVLLYVLYGSNTGSCEGFAQQLASGAGAKGFRVVIATLNSVANKIPTDGPVVIVTASFEGEPADNAAHFVQGLTSTAKVSDLKDVSYAVFGAGNRDWVHTYQRIPTLIDTTLEQKGAKRLLARGEADARGDKFSESFDEWEKQLWAVLFKEYNVEAKGTDTTGVDIKFLGGPTDRATTLRQPDSRLGSVIENRLLTAPSIPAKRHIEFELPEGMTYQAGDYLAILPLNPPEYVHRVLSRFKVSPEQQIMINATGPTNLPAGKQVSLVEVLGGFVEIGQPATKRNISTLLEFAKDSVDRSALESMLADGTQAQSSMLDLLENHPTIDLPLGIFITSLPSMRLRQYSISSSPLSDPSRVTLTISVVSHGQFLGVASNFLAHLRTGDRVQMVVRPSAKAFHPPSDPSVPMVMFTAGSGIAPFRGFIQERAMQAQAGRQVAKSVLFFGCRSPGADYLYGDAELKEWTELGVVDVRPAFSRLVEKSGGSKYVQDRVWSDRKIIKEAFDNGAKFFTCGGSNVALGIRDVCIRIIAENECSETEAEEFLKQIQNERYATDVFG
ncbi:cytochrome P450 family:NADPH-P450 family reductase [Rhizoctonia solani AG-3 Rhs1AP]|uniref:Cytochrome P450 family:NADPH-P450 family reductase n=1 Tax=Rhizoctonia solani AG-3 Rhs1AP TaxID=1086054 RepID=X8IXN6_9AGAM|nr:cytochrome P450 family:NADPH-P450 family reductase [Rhizoctonia solani AG-3 Rhs1AP]